MTHLKNVLNYVNSVDQYFLVLFLLTILISYNFFRESHTIWPFLRHPLFTNEIRTSFLEKLIR